MPISTIKKGRQVLTGLVLTCRELDGFDIVVGDGDVINVTVVKVEGGRARLQIQDFKRRRVNRYNIEE